MRQKHNKTEILEKGIDLFRKKGYHNTGVDDILKACNMPSGSFYNFFKNKEGFAVAALELYNQQYLIYLENVLNNKKVSPLKRLRNVFVDSIKDHVSNDCSKGCLLNSMTSEVATLNLSIGKATSEHYLKNSKALAATIQEGQELGEIRTDFTAMELASYLIDGFAGASTRMQADQSQGPLKLFLKTTFAFIRATEKE